MLDQLPDLEGEVKQQIEKYANNTQLQKDINLGQVKEKVKSIYKNLLQNSGELGIYLTEVANKAIDKVEFEYAEKTTDGSSYMSAISKGIEDTPPYLKIYHLPRTISMYDIEIPVGANEEEKQKIVVGRARELSPECTTWEVKSIRSEEKENRTIWEVVFQQNPRKVWNKQPDFKEIESNNRWGTIFADSEAEDIICDEVSNAVDLLINETKNKYIFKDPDDQDKYDKWVQNIHDRYRDPTKVTDNFHIKVSYKSTDDAELFLIHEIAHLIEHAYLIKTGTKTVNSNPELFSVYMDAKIGASKALRLWEIYKILTAEIQTDFLTQIINEEDRESKLAELKSLLKPLEFLYSNNMDEAKLYFEYPAKDAIAKIRDDFAYKDLSNHIKALYNAIKLRDKNLSILDALKSLSENQSLVLTPANFHELLDYLTN